jgi:hypothetical protein
MDGGGGLEDWSPNFTYSVKKIHARLLLENYYEIMLMLLLTLEIK